MYVYRRTVPIELGRSYMAENWSQELVTLQQFIQTHILRSPPTHHDHEMQRVGHTDEAEERMQRDTERVGYLAQHELFKQVCLYVIITVDRC